MKPTLYLMGLLSAVAGHVVDSMNPVNHAILELKSDDVENMRSLRQVPAGMFFGLLTEAVSYPTAHIWGDVEYGL